MTESRGLEKDNQKKSLLDDRENCRKENVIGIRQGLDDARVA